MTVRADVYQGQDPVTCLLNAKGITVRNHYLSGTTIVTGGAVRLNACELVYRMDDNETVIIVFYCRLNPAVGLKNSFRDLISFCALIAEELPAVRFITGKAEPLASRDSGAISKERLLAMYRRHIGTSLRDDWLYFELDDYRYRNKGMDKKVEWIRHVLKKNNLC